MFDLRIGDYRDVLAGVSAGLLAADPPYGARTHKGHDAGVVLSTKKANAWPREGRDTGDPIRERRPLSYKAWTPEDVVEFCDEWAPRVDGWAVIMSCSDLSPVWRQAMHDHGRMTFAPVPVVIPGMTVRMSGDGPSSWAIYLNISRPRSREFAGGWTRPGAYVVSRGTKERQAAHVGGKPLELMLRIVRDYTRPGDTVVDPCAGYSTTGIAAEALGFPFIGAEAHVPTALAGLARRAEIQSDPEIVAQAMRLAERRLVDAAYGEIDDTHPAP